MVRLALHCLPLCSLAVSIMTNSVFLGQAPSAGLGMPILQPGSFKPGGGICGSLNRLTALKSPTAKFALQYTLGVCLSIL